MSEKRPNSIDTIDYEPTPTPSELSDGARFDFHAARPSLLSFEDARALSRATDKAREAARQQAEIARPLEPHEIAKRYGRETIQMRTDKLSQQDLALAGGP